MAAVKRTLGRWLARSLGACLPQLVATNGAASATGDDDEAHGFVREVHTLVDGDYSSAPHVMSASPAGMRYQGWVMLAVLSVNIVVSYLPWYMFIPIQSESMVVYGVSATDLNVLCILFSVMYIPGVVLTGPLLTALGSRLCFTLAMGLITLGCALRCGPEFVETFSVQGSLLEPNGESPHHPVLSPYSWLVWGTSFCALGHTLVVNATSHLTAEWFPPQGRPAAAMVVNLMNFIGACLSFMQPPFYVGSVAVGATDAQEPSAALLGEHEPAVVQLGALLAAQFRIALGALLLTFAVYRNGPFGRSVEEGSDLEKVSLLSELHHIFSLRDFWVVNGQFALYLAVMNTFDAIEGSLLLSYGYSDELSAQTAVSFLVGSLVSTAFESVILKHPAQYRNTLIGLHALHAATCLLGLACLAACLPPICFVVAVGLMGLTTPGWGCSFEICSEVCYPSREATVCALLEAFGSIVSILGIVAAQPLIDAGTPDNVLLAMVGGCVLSGIMMFGLSGRMIRHEAEEGNAGVELSTLVAGGFEDSATFRTSKKS